MHEFSVRIYHEDTDFAGIVYYANYLKFIERARSELIRSLGIDQTALNESQGIVFAVSKLSIDYLRPALFDDLLTVTTQLGSLSPARIGLIQKVLRGDEILVVAEVTLACLTPSGRPTRLPRDIASKLQSVDG